MARGEVHPNILTTTQRQKPSHKTTDTERTERSRELLLVCPHLSSPLSTSVQSLATTAPVSGGWRQTYELPVFT